MADEAPSKPGPFDVQTIKHLVALMSRHDLSEIDLSEGDQRLRLRRGPHPRAMATMPVPTAPLAMPVSQAPTAPVSAPLPAAEPSRPQRALLEIKAQTPGTFFAAANPGSDPYVRVGSRVNPTTVVCLLEAMKIFNEILAECSGVIAEVLVENNQPVEYGQVLFRVDPTM